MDAWRALARLGSWARGSPYGALAVFMREVYEAAGFVLAEKCKLMLNWLF